MMVEYSDNFVNNCENIATETKGKKSKKKI